MQSMTANDPAVPGSLATPVPLPHTASSNGLTLRPPSPPLPSSSSHSGPPSSHLSLNNFVPSSSSSLGSDTFATQRQEIREAWIDAEGEIPVSRLHDDAELLADLFQVLNKNDESWTPILSGMLASKDSGGKNSWRDGHCALLDSHCKQPAPSSFPWIDSC